MVIESHQAGLTKKIRYCMPTCSSQADRNVVDLKVGQI